MVLTPQYLDLCKNNDNMEIDQTVDPLALYIDDDNDDGGPMPQPLLHTILKNTHTHTLVTEKGSHACRI